MLHSTSGKEHPTSNIQHPTSAYLLTYLLSSFPNSRWIPVFYTLPKIQKQTQPENHSHSVMIQVSQQNKSHHFVNYLLQPIPKVQESYLKDTTDFLNFIDKTKVSKNTIPLTLEGSTNIPQEEGITTDVIHTTHAPKQNPHTYTLPQRYA